MRSGQDILFAEHCVWRSCSTDDVCCGAYDHPDVYTDTGNGDSDPSAYARLDCDHVFQCRSGNHDQRRAAGRWGYKVFDDRGRIVPVAAFCPCGGIDRLGAAVAGLGCAVLSPSRLYH